MREALVAGQALRRPVKRRHGDSISPLGEDLMGEVLRIVDMTARVNEMLLHSHANVGDLVSAATRHQCNPASADFRLARDKVMDNSRGYKSRTVARGKRAVKDACKKQPELWNTDPEGFRIFWSRGFSSANYYGIFDYLQKVVDYDGSSEKGKWFMRSKSKCFKSGRGY